MPEVSSNENRESATPPSCNPVAHLPLVVFDEFTSVVDRNVAKVCSAAIAKGIRRGHIPCRFVAVTCHYDVAEWLEPDWVLDMATVRARNGGVFGGRPIELEIHRCSNGCVATV